MGSLRHSRVAVLFLLMISVVPICHSFESERLPDLKVDPISPLFGEMSSQQPALCKQVPPRHLRQVMGSAFNEFYMSDTPPEGAVFDLRTGREKVFIRRSSNLNATNVTSHSFFVKPDLNVTLSEEPAWNVDFSRDSEDSEGSFVYLSGKKEEAFTRSRRNGTIVKRSVPESVLDAIGSSGEAHRFRWHCEVAPRWVDLGPDYYPRYVLSINCNHHDCQGYRFTCEPRSFAIKLLKRKSSVCAPRFRPDKDSLQIGSDQMPETLSELWVWEMRALTFCCVCRYRGARPP